MLSVEPHQWALDWKGFGHWGGAVYVALVNLAVLAGVLLARATARGTAAVG